MLVEPGWDGDQEFALEFLTSATGRKTVNVDLPITKGATMRMLLTNY